jgi:Rps23 Pro-64 3,4-dihydroxylase Tpa1-like proline 4-hydroxylase
MPRFNPLDHPICLAYPQWLAPSAWIEHVPFAMYVVDLLRPRVFVELGSYYGVSYCAFCQAIAELQLPTRAYAIDTWQGDPHNGFYGSEVLDALSAHHQPLYGGFSRLIQQSFNDALGSFEDGSIDLLHIDGYHTYDAVKHDFETWLPKLSERAVVLFHDIDVREPDFGVWKLWEELTQRYPHFSFDHGHGLGVLAVGAEYPQALQELLDADADETALIREVFYQLGLRLRTHQQRDRQRHELTAQLDQRKRTDAVALCCYFDRVARMLTLGESHFGLRPAARRHTQTEALTLCCYGVEVRLVDDAGLGLCQRLRDTLPPEFRAPSEPSQVSVAYVVTAIVPPGLTEASEFLITCDDVAVFATAVEEEVYWWLRRDIDQAVARRSSQLLFVHAGVVGWRGVGIVIPGRASIGKSTLVAELVRRGAVYYSDAFAVLDDQGRVHPYRGMIGLGVEDQPQDLRLIREDGSTQPLPIGLIVSGAYTPEVIWRPTVIRGSHAALPLVDSTVLAREDAPRIQQIAAQVAAGAVALRGPRSEAAEVATLLLDTVDDALVSRAIDAAGDDLGRLADELARVAEIRLRSPDGRIVSPPRRLEAARYVRITDFLSLAEHERMLKSALAWEKDFQESGVVGADGKSEIDNHSRKSRTLAFGRLEELWDMFDERLRAMLPVVRQQLGIPWFPLSRVERQLTAHGRGGFFAPHVDTGDALVFGRRISCVYYFHQLPKRFSGGELKLYDTWVTPTGSTGAGTYTALEPVDNSLVFFPSDAFHEVCPVYPETDAFADSRFTVTIWFWEPVQPVQLTSQPA